MIWKRNGPVNDTTTGIDRAQDILQATKKLGHGTPLGFDWHHHQDMVTMQLVPSEIHRSAPHRGGCWTRLQAGHVTPLYIGEPNPSVTFRSQLDNLTPNALMLWEQQHAGIVPDDYRRLLLGCNGGVPSAAGLLVPARAGIPPSTTIIRLFYGIGNARFITIDWALQLYGSRLPENAVPIAEDHCGNLVVLWVNGDQRGAVLFWDHEQEDSGDGPLFPLASSFSEFMHLFRI